MYVNIKHYKITRWHLAQYVDKSVYLSPIQTSTQVQYHLNWVFVHLKVDDRRLGEHFLRSKKKLFKIKSCSQIQIFLKIVNEIKNISWEANSWNDLFSFNRDFYIQGERRMVVQGMAWYFYLKVRSLLGGGQSCPHKFLSQIYVISSVGVPQFHCVPVYPCKYWIPLPDDLQI